MLGHPSLTHLAMSIRGNGVAGREVQVGAVVWVGWVVDRVMMIWFGWML